MIYLVWILVFFIALVALIFFAFIMAFRPNSPDQSVAKLKEFLGYPFKGAYQIIKHESRNNHPDRPLHVSISLPAETFEKVVEFLEGIGPKERINFSQNNQVRYETNWVLEERVYYKIYSALHTSNNYQFFGARLEVNLDDHTITYRETSY